MAKLTRQERRARAARRRDEYYRQILETIKQTAVKRSSLSDALKAGDVLINNLCKAHPQEKTLIAQAVYQIRSEIMDKNPA